MHDVIVKLRILCDMLSSCIEDWRTNVWAKDLDKRYCCDGRECGCYGLTLRQVCEWNRTHAQ